MILRTDYHVTFVLPGTYGGTFQGWKGKKVAEGGQCANPKSPIHQRFSEKVDDTTFGIAETVL